jgi:hypothetical protein
MFTYNIKFLTLALIFALIFTGCMDDGDDSIDTSGAFDYTITRSYQLGAVTDTNFERIYDY